MRWFRAKRIQHPDTAAAEANSFPPELKDFEHKTENNTTNESVPRSDPKVVLPIVFSLCLAVFLTALVCLPYGSITMQLTVLPIRIEPSLESQYPRSQMTSSPSMTSRGTKARTYLRLPRYNCQSAKYTYAPLFPTCIELTESATDLFPCQMGLRCTGSHIRNRFHHLRRSSQLHRLHYRPSNFGHRQCGKHNWCKCHHFEPPAVREKTQIHRLHRRNIRVGFYSRASSWGRLREQGVMAMVFLDKCTNRCCNTCRAHPTFAQQPTCARPFGQTPPGKAEGIRSRRDRAPHARADITPTCAPVGRQ
jgi:hypothetical protein